MFRSKGGRTGTALLAAVSVVPLCLSASPAQQLPGQYKKHHRPIIAQLAQGNVDAAIGNLQKLLEKAPDDVESIYCLAMAYSVRGDGERALAEARKAVAAGMPVERLVAGPRSLNAALLAAPGFNELAGDGATVLVHGPLLGDLRPRSVKVWLRTARESEIQVVAFPKSAEPEHVKVNAKAQERDDFTAVVELVGLAPGTEYRYQILQDGKEVKLSHETNFRTPAEDGGEKIKIVFGGGAGFTPKFEHMWDTIGKHQPDAILLLGDNVYIDRPEVQEVGEVRYYRRQSRPEWRKLTSHVPVYAIWDDHDFGTNDCHGGVELDKPAWKPRVWRDFQRQWPNPAYGGGGKVPGCFFSHRIGQRVEFFFLDTRYYREPKTPVAQLEKNPRGLRLRNMLGPEQLAWLKKSLVASQAQFKVICSSVPMTANVKPGSNDTWDGYPEEREEIFSFLTENGIEGVFVLAADRHRSDAWKIERPAPAYPIYEFMSSKLTNIHTHKIIDGCLFGYNQKPSFGEVVFDFSQPEPTATYTAYSIDDETVGSVVLRLGNLRRK